MSKVGVAVAAHRGDQLVGGSAAEEKFEFVKEACADSAANVASAINSSSTPIKLYIIYPGFPEDEKKAIEAAAKSVSSVQHVVVIPEELGSKSEAERSEWANAHIKDLTFT